MTNAFKGILGAKLYWSLLFLRMNSYLFGELFYFTYVFGLVLGQTYFFCDLYNLLKSSWLLKSKKIFNFRDQAFNEMTSYFYFLYI